MSLPTCLLNIFSSLYHIWPRLALVAALILSFSWSVVYANPSDPFDEHDARLWTYPRCSRAKLAKDVLPADSPRRAYDGNLSQFHAYLSCVWWSGGPDVSTVGNWGPAEYPFYNSQCADMYSCVPYHPSKDDDFILPADRGDRSCGLNVMDLILARRNHVDGNGKSAPLADICQAKIQDPIEIVCPDARKDEQETAKRRGTAYHPAPPNPCVSGSENFYMPYLIKSKAKSF